MSLYLQWIYRRIRLSGLIGLTLIFASLLWYTLGVVPLKSERLALSELLVQKISQAKLRPAEAVVVDPVDVMLENLPLVTALPDLLGKIHGAADQLGLDLIRGDYRLQEEKGEHLTRYRVILPVAGGYPEVRLLISEVLTQLPNAALEKVTLTRENVADDGVEARLEWVLYFREP